MLLVLVIIFYEIWLKYCKNSVFCILEKIIESTVIIQTSVREIIPNLVEVPYQT